MIPYLGDFPEDATVIHYFNTFSSNDPSASVTITNLADADLYVHKDGSTTQITTDGATVVIDFDSRTGVHKITIDTSVDAAYSTGAEYVVLMEGTTVDAGTVTAALFTFSIERAGGVLALLKGTNSLANIEDKIDIIDTNVDQIETAVITNAAGIDIAADIIAIKAETVLIVADTNELQTDDIPGTLGSPAGASLAADLVVIDNFVDGLETSVALIPQSGGSTVWNATALATINTEVDGALDTVISELGVAAPAVTPTLRTAVMLMYMALRNKLDVQTSGTDALEIHNDAGTEITSKLITDDGSDYSEAKMT